MKELVFFLEEPSAAAMLEGVLPRIIGDELVFPRLITFEGKQDLEQQLVRRIRGYRTPDAKFIVMRDQDSHPDCIAVKDRISSLCANAGRPDCMVRIACHELESFYLADLAAVENGLELTNIAIHQLGAKFRNPDQTVSPADELRKLTNGMYQKVSGSRVIGRHLDLENNRSPSFRNLIDGIRRMIVT